MHVKGKRPQAETEIIPFYFLCIYIIFIYEKKRRRCIFSFPIFILSTRKQGESPGKRTKGVSVE